MVNVYTIIVTYNGADWIEKCVDSLLLSSYPSNIVLVDNCSTDETLTILKKYDGQFQLIKTNENLGFGGGNNIGIQYAVSQKAEYVFLVNQDAYVQKDCIGTLIQTLEKNKDIGILSPLQMAPDGISIDPTFKKYLIGALTDAALKELDSGSKTMMPAPVPVRFVNAASWMMPVEAQQKVGLFNPVFFHYGEDNHYCSRMQYHGYKTAVDCNATLIHDRGNATPDRKKNLLRQLKAIPLYTLLDIRKNFLLAWLLGFNKLLRIKKKMKPYFTDDIKDIYKEQKSWFKENLDKAKQIREESKKDARIRK